MLISERARTQAMFARSDSMRPRARLLPIAILSLACLPGGQACGDPPVIAGLPEDGRSLADGPCQTNRDYPAPLPMPGARTANPVAEGFSFVEGPVWHAELGVLFFSDMDMGESGPNGVASRILRLTPPSTVDVFVASSGSNGLGLAPDGRLLAATHDARTLALFDPRTGARETLDLEYMGQRFNSPNDLAVASDGTVFFTDPDWQLPPRASETGNTGVYRYTPGGAVDLVDGTLNKPNGIALSPDGTRLYVGSLASEILVYPVESGTVGAPSVFASPGASDGLAVDCAGNLYVTSGDVVVYDANGKELGRITVPEQPTNVAFGGPDARTLYITARTGLYRIELAVPGYPF